MNTNLSLLLILTTCFALHAEIINVPDDHETIQGAINASEDGDTVLAAPGEYVENINFGGKAIVVIGNPLDPSEVVIDGDDNGSVVVFDSEENEDSIFKGFSVTNGNSHNGDGVLGNGGGIFCGESSNPTLSDLIISNNIAGTYGGGIYISGGETTLANVLISDNSARDAGGALFSFGTLTLINSSIIHNEVELQYAGGIFLSNQGENRFEQVLLCNNPAENGYGGAMFVINWGGSCTFNQVTVVGNIGEVIDGLLLNTTLAEITNSIVHSNDEDNIMIRTGSLTVSFSDIEGGVDGIGQQNEPEINWNDGNIDTDPLFADPDNGDYHLTEDSPCIDAGDPDSPEDPDGTRADMGAYYFHQREIAVDMEELHFDTLFAAQETEDLTFTVQNLGQQLLTVESMMIDGDYFAVDNNDGFNVESDGEQALTVTFAPEDSGHFEGTLTINSNAVNGEAVVSLTGDARWWLAVDSEQDHLPANFSITSIYPNPFNSTTNITYQLPTESHLDIALYDISGRQVMTLFSGVRQAGVWSTTLNGNNLSSGIYFIKMNLNDQQISQKVMLLK